MASDTTSPSAPMQPTKRIVSKAHLDAWLTSPTHADVVAFVQDLNDSVVGVKLTDKVPSSPVRCLLVHAKSLKHPLTQLHRPPQSRQAVDALVDVLDVVERLYNETPPVDNGTSRFGNPAFRDFYDKVASVRCSCLAAPHLSSRETDRTTWTACV